MENEEDKELTLTDGVPETPETEEKVEQVQTEASNGEGQAQEEVEPEKKYTQEDVDNIINARFAREKRNYERETEKYKELESIMKTALEAESLDDVIKKSKDFYKKNGVEIPEYKSALAQEDEEMLGNGYADKIIATGDYQYMEQEANRIAAVPVDKRTARENVMFNKLCEALIENKNKKILSDKGMDANILNDQNFKKFREKLNYNTPIIEAVEMFNKLNTPTEKKEKPYSVGSVKNNVKVNEIKEYYSPEDFDKLTEEDLNNPEIMKAVDRSRLKWFK